MQSNVSLTAQDFGQCLKRAVALHHGVLFFPYRIIRSSFTPPKEMGVAILDHPQSAPIHSAQRSTRDDFSGEFVLTKEDVCHGMSSHIRVIMMGSPYEGDCIGKLSFELPNEITIVLELTDRGMAAEKGQHVFSPIG